MLTIQIAVKLIGGGSPLFRQAVFRQLHFATHAHDVPAFTSPAFSTPGIGPVFSSPAISTHALWSRVFQSRFFHPCDLVPRFPVPRFQSPPRTCLAVEPTRFTPPYQTRQNSPDCIVSGAARCELALTVTVIMRTSIPITTTTVT